MSSPHRSPMPSPRTKRLQLKPAPPASPLMIKRSGMLLNFSQAYGVKLDKNRIHSGITNSSGSVYSVASQGSAAIVRMNEAMSEFWNYFEVEIVSPGQKGCIGIGVGPCDSRLHGQPGWTVQTFGYHADNGYLYNQSGYAGLPFGPTCTKGDVMGCGIDFESAAITGYARLWFTKNSTFVGSPVKVKVPPKGFFSLIGMQYTGVVVKYLGHSQQKTPYSIQVLSDYPFPHTLLTMYPQDGVGRSQLNLRVGDEVNVSEEEWLHGCEWLEGTKVSDGTVGLLCRQFVRFERQTDSQPLYGAASNADENIDQVHMYKGKEFAFVKEPETWYACIICQELAVSPQQTTCCAQTLCQSCTDACQRRHLVTCPHCRKENWETSRDARLTRLISDLEVLCQNHNKGCQWRGELRDLQDHLDKKCDLHTIPCPNGCNVRIERKNLAKHTRVECLDSRAKCPFCSSAMTRRELFFHHYKLCANWPALCPHLCKEKATWTKGQLTRHLENGCDEEIVMCEFASAGCHAEVMRRELKEHMQSALSSHLSLLLRENIALKKEVKDLKDTVNLLQHQLS